MDASVDSIDSTGSAGEFEKDAVRVDPADTGGGLPQRQSSLGKFKRLMGGRMKSAQRSARSFFSELKQELKEAAAPQAGAADADVPAQAGGDAGALHGGGGDVQAQAPAADAGTSESDTATARGQQRGGGRGAGGFFSSLAAGIRNGGEADGERNASDEHEVPMTPWEPTMPHEQRLERAFRARILKVSKESWRFAQADGAGGSAVDASALMSEEMGPEPVDDARMVQARAVLDVDPALSRLRYTLVPRVMEEEAFWAAYFNAVDDAKREVLTASASAEAASHERVMEAAAIDWDDDASVERASAAAESHDSGHVNRGGAHTENASGSSSSARRPRAGSSVPRASAAMSSEGLRTLADALALAKGWRSMEALACSRTGRAPQAAAESGAPRPEMLPSGADGDDSIGGGGSGGARADLNGIGLSFMRGIRNALDRVNAGVGDGSPHMAALAAGDAAALLEPDERSALYTLFDIDAPRAAFDMSGGAQVSMVPLEIGAAPPAGFLSCLAMVFSLQHSAPAMARFWLACCDEFAWHWTHGVPLARVPLESAPDTRFCLLHQKLELLNCCIARRARRRRWQETEKAVRERARAAKLPDDGSAVVPTRVGVLRRLGDSRLLSSDAPLCVPVTQESAVLSEDMMRETEELLMRTGSMGAGAQQLQGDIAAFKAANPGAELTDFVRWHSRSDWLVPEGASEAEGRLSARMVEEGNMWQTLWNSTPPQPAGEQPPLFDEQHVGDGVVEYLRGLAPSEVLETAFLSALGAAHTAASVAKGADTPPLSEALADARAIAAQMAGRGMSETKVENLVSMFEQLEEWLVKAHDAQREEMRRAAEAEEAAAAEAAATEAAEDAWAKAAAAEMAKRASVEGDAPAAGTDGDVDSEAVAEASGNESTDGTADVRAPPPAANEAAGVTPAAVDSEPVADGTSKD